MSKTTGHAGNAPMAKKAASAAAPSDAHRPLSADSALRDVKRRGDALTATIKALLLRLG